ncbi:hypothetical protein CALCODRAFT_481764 [Calocera cornea HHB12733]|uniref:Uncharacterized protein n=1 Tax=Calocera cornea HHB12733 TaxID=1353952 RepID=A0A165HE71_9BASI|nr:hypothetical protein CALCODRAFT_481764 [Calocera cornea HHB12733]
MPPRSAAPKSKTSRTTRPIKSTQGKPARLAKATRFTLNEDDDIVPEEDDEVAEEDDEEDDGIDEATAKRILATKKKTPANKVDLNSAIAKHNKATMEALAQDREEAENEMRASSLHIRVLREKIWFINSVLDSDPPLSLNPVLDLIGARNKEAEDVQALYASLIDIVSANKDKELEATETLFYAQGKERAKSYKKTIKWAKAALDEGHGNQKAAADPSELIKHFIRAVAA